MFLLYILLQPEFESVSYEIDFAKNDIIDALNNLDNWAKPQQVNAIVSKWCLKLCIVLCEE